MGRIFPVLVFFALVAIVSYLLNIAIGVCISELLLALSIIYILLRIEKKEKNLLLFYSIFSLLYMLGNILVVYTMDTPDAAMFDYYLSKDDVAEAAFISFIGYCSFIIGYSSDVTIFKNYKFSSVISERQLNNAFLVVLLYHVQGIITGIQIQLLLYFTYPVLLLYVKHSVLQNKRVQINWAILLVFIMALKGLLYSYRRQEAFEPFVIFFVALFVAYNGDWKQIAAPKYILVLFCFLFIGAQFNILGKIRTSYGEARVNEWLNYYNKEDNAEWSDNMDDPYNDNKNIFARSSTLNQLSQVVALTEEKGYYEGSTMTYIIFAFIPRAIWPEKPLIMQGRWFAMEAGLAYNHGMTNSLAEVNNSINMTVPGELYLNFSLIGVIIGMGIVGILLHSLWDISDFFNLRSNLAGVIFGLFLIAVAYFYLLVDLQFLVTLAQVFITCIILNFVLSKV